MIIVQGEEKQKQSNRKMKSIDWPILILIVVTILLIQPGYINGQNMAVDVKKEDCKGSDEMECLDERVHELFVNINRFYSPDDHYIDISYLNHRLYNSTNDVELKQILKYITSLPNFDQFDTNEQQIIKSFPNRLIN